MRVIAGEARGFPLVSCRDRRTRPTSDKVKGAMFSVLDVLLAELAGDDGGGWEEKKVLDLYAGSGALGIEALSRGAAFADFVESDRAAVLAIGQNLDRTKLGERAKVVRMSVESALRKLRGAPRGPYDLVFLDPPYTCGLVADVLRQLYESNLLVRMGLVVLEHKKDLEIPSSIGDLHLVRSRRHGDSAFSVFQFRSEA